MNDQKFDSEIALLCSINLTVGILVIIINTIPFSVLLVMKKFNSEISLVFASVTIQMIDGVQFLIRGVRCHTINKWSYVPLVFVGECLMTNFEIHLPLDKFYGQFYVLHGQPKLNHSRVENGQQREIHVTHELPSIKPQQPHLDSIRLAPSVKAP
ncbi:hypothetical protein T4E_9537 [Trichinella pseudospiralis]|uniref:Uncharacterized protein n=1 Tax=Trichinella pseudospiralis TaxID=6337 RepID=A0A0V0Y3R4_TRIPS|nr:hypothetical protein T4E_9537 [Trichinella pseudospiralis]